MSQLHTSRICSWVNHKNRLSTLRCSEYKTAAIPNSGTTDRNYSSYFVAKNLEETDRLAVEEFALYISTVLLNSSRTCNNPHHGTPPDRNQDQGYRRELASLSVVKERLVPSPSECPRVSGTCLVGLIEPQRAARPSSIIFRN